MPKNVVLCCDGTANEFAPDRTNVVKLFFTLAHDPNRQVAYYHPGLGTMEPPGALTRGTRAVTRLLGKAIRCGFPCRRTMPTLKSAATPLQSTSAALSFAPTSGCREILRRRAGPRT